MKSYTPCQSGRGSAGRIMGVLIFLVILVGSIYYFYTSGGSVKDALHSIKETSQDAATTTKVKTALALSKQVSAFDVNIDTRQGEVTLTGQVPSEEIKAMAGAIAQDTSGVKQLNNKLVIDPSARPNPETGRLGERVADLEIKILVNDGLMKSPELKDKGIELLVKERMVTLSGTVETGTQKNTAQQIAWGVQNVQGVINNITVRGSQVGPESADDRLSRRVEFELYSTRAFSLNTLQIKSDAGTVTLSGSVSSQAEKLLAEKIAQTVEGVRKVVNNLTVMREIEKQ